MLEKINHSEDYIINYLHPFGISIVAKRKMDFSSIFSSHDLKKLVRKHRLVLFKGFNEVSSDQLVNYAKSMGDLLEWDFGNVMEMKVQEKPKNYLFTNNHVPFHWDGAFHKEPRFLLFHCIEAPDKNAGGETLFTDTHKIWNDASEAEKALWSRYSFSYETEKLAHYGGVITVPLVQTHPDTHEKILRFAEPVPDTMPNPVKVNLVNTDKAVEEKFIQEMSLKCYSEQYCYTHTWEKNDFLIADNNILLHARNVFKQFSPRHLRRIQVL